MFSSLKTIQPAETAVTERWLLWMDGVGAWLILIGDEITLGRSGGTSPLLKQTQPGKEEADIAMTGNLSRRHVTFRRDADAWLLQPHSVVTMGGRSIQREQLLQDDCELALNQSVKLAFQLPTPLSLSARLTVRSEHRLSMPVSGAVLMAETCLLGSGTENHIRCPAWPGTVILIRSPHGLSVKSRMPLTSDGTSLTGTTPIRHGQIIRGHDLQLRFERITQSSAVT